MATKYPLGVLLNNLQEELNLTKSQFLKRLGLKNIGKAIRKLDDLILNGNVEISFLQKLIDCYPGKKIEILFAVSETRKQLEAEHFTESARIEEKDRNNFRPYIYIETELSVPSPIFAAALIGRKAKYLDIKVRDYNLKFIGQTVSEHFIRNKGKSMCFGQITGYRFVDSYDTSIRLDINGNVIDYSVTKFISTPQASLSVGKRKTSLEELKTFCLEIEDENIN